MDLAQEAIHAAIANDWQKAIELNEKIIAHDAANIEAILRLGHAYFESGNTPLSLKFAKKALTIDPDNVLAKRCITKCNVGRDAQPTTRRTNLKAFLEQPGKTRLVKLVRLGEPKILAGLSAGEQLRLTVNSQKVSVETESGHYIGRFPDDIASRIITTKTSHPWAAIKFATPTEVSVVMHED